ncbi:MAG: hypothetical protein R2712_31700 [Vicinamibacterales bacterium]
MSIRPEAWDDARIDRVLRGALDVEPPPSLAPRVRLAIRDQVPASSWQTWRGWAWAAAGVCAAALVGGVLVEPRPDAWPAVTPIVSAAFPMVASAVAVGAAAPADPNRRRRPAEPPVPASRGDDHPVRTAAVFDPREREAFLALLAAGPLAAAAPAVLARAAGDTREDDGMPPVSIAPLDVAPLEVSGLIAGERQ